MAGLRRDLLCRRWVHSREEDTAAELVFRAAQFPFPRSRGRDAFELLPDGRLVEYPVGPADRREARHGRWTLEADRLVFLSDAPSSARSMRVVAASEDRLTLRRPDAPG
jgi:hypothetical protein